MTLIRLSSQAIEPLRVSPLRASIRARGATDDLSRQSCPDCGFIWEACECDMPVYRGAFDTEGRH